MNATHTKKLVAGFRAGDLLVIHENTTSWYLADDEWKNGGFLMEHSYAVFLEHAEIPHDDRTFIRMLVSQGARVVDARYVRKAP